MALSLRTPCLSKVLRFIRIVCHDAWRAISVQALVSSGDAVNIRKGTSGIGPLGSFFQASKSRIRSGSSSGSYGFPMR